MQKNPEITDLAMEYYPLFNRKYIDSNGGLPASHVSFQGGFPCTLGSYCPWIHLFALKNVVEKIIRRNYVTWDKKTVAQGAGPTNVI